MAIKGKILEWCYDTCVNDNVYYDKPTFKSYYEINYGQEVQMGSEGRSRFIGMGSMKLNFTFRKKEILIDVFHVLDMNMNIVSGDLLGKLDIKSIYESVKLILTCNNVYVGKGYSA